MRPITLVLAAFAALIVGVAAETFEERVDVAPLPDGAIALTFRFDSSSSSSARHRSKTSKTLASVLAASRATEIELWFGRGRWNARRWGAPSITARPIGAEVRGSWRTRAEAERGWRTATTTLGGVFCASLSTLMDSEATTEPMLAFRDWEGGALGRRAIEGEDIIKHASLPAEAVCVENLAPWLKQLPCRDRAGLAKALKTAHMVFGASHLTFGLRLWTEGDLVRVEQTLMMVLPGDGEAFRSVLGIIRSAKEGLCIATDRSLVRVIDGDAVRTFDTASFDMSDSDVASLRTHVRKPQLFVERFLTGSGNENGGVVIDVERATSEVDAPSAPIRVRLFQPLPWFVRMYMHTLSIEFDGRVAPKGALEGIRYVPAQDRVRSSLIEMQIVIPNNASSMRLSVDYDKGFLRAHEFPPDANRGFDLPPGRLDFFSIEDAEGTPVKAARESGARPEAVYMNGLLFPLPTPDFSMSYNVAAITGSALSALLLSAMRSMISREAWRDYRS